VVRFTLAYGPADVRTKHVSRQASSGDEERTLFLKGHDTKEFQLEVIIVVLILASKEKHYEYEKLR